MSSSSHVDPSFRYKLRHQTARRSKTITALLCTHTAMNLRIKTTTILKSSKENKTTRTTLRKGSRFDLQYPLVAADLAVPRNGLPQRRDQFSIMAKHQVALVSEAVMTLATSISLPREEHVYRIHLHHCALWNLEILYYSVLIYTI